MRHYSHGEVNIFQSESIPRNAIKIEALNDGYKIADSEVTFNYHMVEDKEGVEMYEKDGVFYLKNEVPVDVFCVVKERHDNITLDPGIWEIEPAKEYDYLTQERKNVAD